MGYHGEAAVSESISENLQGILPISATADSNGVLSVGGIPVHELAEEFGTPLYVYDAAHLRSLCRRYSEAMETGEPQGLAIFATKAFPAMAMIEVATSAGMGVDVASGGELYLALEAGADPEFIYYHGNAKSPAEIEAGLTAGVGRFVVDNFDELARLDELASRLVPGGRKQKVLVRTTPGIEAHTHEFIKTGHEDSKFGFFLSDGSALEALAKAARSRYVEPTGIHMHIGSQILDLEPFVEEAKIAIEFLASARRELSLELSEVDFGGGLGARYMPGDNPPEPEQYVKTLKEAVIESCNVVGIPLPRIVVEPGRSITANAGMTVYTVQSVKTTPSGRTWVGIDGGMSDNLRPMLYGADYLALVPTKLLEPQVLKVHIAGKHCESGDVVARDVPVPRSIAAGDLLVTPATGAYGWAMASNYNGQPRPAVVFVENGEARVVVERETYRDLARLQRKLDGRS
jgi:diaminopimelate decarboxylase